MSTVASIASRPSHPGLAVAATWPPELRRLLGGGAQAILMAATEPGGGRLQHWRARQVTHHPGRSTVVSYRAKVQWPGRAPTEETIVATTGDRIPHGAALFHDGETTIGVWRWPVDPALPALSTALDRRRVACLLDGWGVGGGATRLRVRAYRPGRRAVLEATAGRGSIFLKVVRPTAVEALHRTHRLLAASLPVPDSLGWTDDGLLVLPGLAGSTLRELLRSGSSRLPDPGAIDELLDRLPGELAAGPRRVASVDAVDHHARVIASAMPSLQGRLDDLVGSMRRRALAAHDLVAVHGDLYESQLLVDAGRVCGLLDVDTAGAGHRVEDVANLCAHLSVLASVSTRPVGINRYGAAVLAHAEQRFDRGDLRVRIAASIIGLATGPFRVLEPDWPGGTRRRVELAAHWLDSIDA